MVAGEGQNGGIHEPFRRTPNGQHSQVLQRLQVIENSFDGGDGVACEVPIDVLGAKSKSGRAFEAER